MSIGPYTWTRASMAGLFNPATMKQVVNWLLGQRIWMIWEGQRIVCQKFEEVRVLCPTLELTFLFKTLPTLLPSSQANSQESSGTRFHQSLSYSPRHPLPLRYRV